MVWSLITMYEMQKKKQKIQSSVIMMKFWRQSTSPWWTNPIRNGKYFMMRDYTFVAVNSADAVLPGLYALLPSVSEIVNRLINLGLTMNPSVQSNTKFPNIVSIIVTNIYSFCSRVIFTI